MLELERCTVSSSSIFGIYFFFFAPRDTTQEHSELKMILFFLNFEFCPRD